MQSLSISVLSLPVGPIADQVISDGLPPAGEQGGEGAFAAMLKGQTMLAATGGAASVSTEKAPQALGDAASLPLFAATGKSLPHPGSRTADVLPAEAEIDAGSEDDAEQTIAVAAVPMFVSLPLPVTLLASPGIAKAEEQAAIASERAAPVAPVALPKDFQAQIVGSAIELPVASAERMPAVLADPVSMVAKASSAAQGDTDAATALRQNVISGIDTPSAQTAAPLTHGPATLVPAIGTQPSAGTSQGSVQITVAAAPAAVTTPDAPAQAPIALRLADIAAAHAPERGESVGMRGATDEPGKTQPVSIAPAATPSPLAAADNATSGRPGEQATRDERPASPVRLAMPAESGDKVAPHAPLFRGPAISELAPPSPSPLTAASLSSPAMPDRAESVASIVDRLISAREAGLGALATVALGHREFGDITVSFAQQGNALEVSVSAADRDSQQALAAAIASADRPAPRDQAAAPSTSASQNGLFASQNRDGDGQPSRDSANRQSRGEATGDPRGAKPANAAPPESEAATPGRGGLYV